MALTPQRNPIPRLNQNTGATGTTQNPQSITTKDGVVTSVTPGSAASPSGGGSGGGGSTSAPLTANAPLALIGSTLTVAEATATTDGVLTLAGDLGGTATSPLVVGLQGFPVASTAPTSGQVPTWNGADYVPQTPGGAGGGLFSYAIVAPPALASFTWLNQGTATAQNNNAGAIMMSMPNGGGFPTTNWRVLYLAAPATPYTLVAYLHSLNFFEAGSAATTGLYFYDSSSGKLIGLETLYLPGTTVSWRVQRLNSATSDNTSVYASLTMQGSHLGFGGGAWGRLRNDGTTLYFDISQDGVNWRSLYSEAVGAWLTPNNIGWGGILQTSTTTNYEDISLLSWSVM
jgi:hypothetical protein